MRASLAAVALLLAAAAGPAAAEEGDGLSAAAERGRLLYRGGESPSGGEVLAVLAGGAVELPAASLTCASCHGQDGRGRAEGGVTPSDLTWPALTRPYEVETGGRRRGPYDEAKLIRAIALGVDPSGNRLDAVMPRYRMSRQDAGDLVAYLRLLGRDADPGVGDDAIRLGVLLAPEGPGDGAARAVRSTLDAAAAAVNGAGGVYQRRLELVYRRLPATVADRTAAAEAFLAAERPFALLAPAFFGAEEPLAALAAAVELPVIGPLALSPPLSAIPDRWVFYLDPGLTGMARALVRHGHALAAGHSAVLVREQGGSAAAEVAAAARGEAERLGWSLEEVVLAGDAADRVAVLGAGEVATVLVIAGGDASGRFLAAATETGWRPTVLAVGPLAGPELLRHAAGFRGRLLLAFPTVPGDRTQPGIEALRRTLAVGAAADPAAPPAVLGATEVAAFVAMDVLVEGLRRAGRALSRDGLVTALEGLRDHRTGLMPPLTYGPNRRHGTGGAWVVEVGEAAPGGTDAAWVELVR